MTTEFAELERRCNGLEDEIARLTEALAVLRSALPDIEGWKSVTAEEGYCKPTGRPDVDLCEPVLERIRQALAEDTGGEG